MSVHILQPGVMTYDAWVAKTEGYLVGMREYIERVLKFTPPPTGMHIHIDKEGLYDALFRYAYQTSANRFRSYTIIE